MNKVSIYSASIMLLIPFLTKNALYIRYIVHYIEHTPSFAVSRELQSKHYVLYNERGWMQPITWSAFDSMWTIGGFYRMRKFKLLGKRIACSMGVASILSVPLCTVGWGSAAVTAYANTTAGVNSTNGTAGAVDTLLKPYVSAGAFSGTVLLEKHGTVLVDSGYGFANLANGVKNTADTRYAIGRLTQQFTAVAIMQLKEKGLLNLTDTVSKFFPNGNQAGQYITVAELLTHTSGAPIGPNLPASLPGTVFQESPLNYVLLGEIIKAVTGQTVDAYIQQNILTPLAMNNTGFITTSMQDVPNAALGYVRSNNTITPINLNMAQFSGASDMYSTAGDMLKWDQALYSSQLLNRDDTNMLFLPTKLSLDTLKTYGYGAGWEVSPDGNRVEGESAVTGYGSIIYRDMAHDETLIILDNQLPSPLAQISQQLEFVLNHGNLPTPPQHSTVGGPKQIFINGKPLFDPDGRIAFGTMHMPIWYIGQALQTLGIKQTWDGVNRIWNITFTGATTFTFGNTPIGQGNTDIYVNGQLVMRIDTYAWVDPSTTNHAVTTYAPIYYIQQILRDGGVPNSWNGEAWSVASQ